MLRNCLKCSTWLYVVVLYTQHILSTTLVFLSHIYMSSFRSPWNASSNSSNNSIQPGNVNRFSTIKRSKCVDLSDPNLFPNLDGTVNDTHDSGVQQDISSSTSSSCNPIEDCGYSAPVRPWYIPEKEIEDIEKDTVPSGWVLMTSTDSRKPIHKQPVPDSDSETDDEDTMPMTTSRKPKKNKSKSEPNVELTTAEILELFRLDVARHDRDVVTREDDDIYEEFTDEDEYKYKWRRDSDPYFSTDEGYMDEEDDEEYYEYE